MSGTPAFVKDKMIFIELMERLYREVSKNALEVAFGLKDDKEEVLGKNPDQPP